MPTLELKKVVVTGLQDKKNITEKANLLKRLPGLGSLFNKENIVYYLNFKFIETIFEFSPLLLE
jgi:hypothetical protein